MLLLAPRAVAPIACRIAPRLFVASTRICPRLSAFANSASPPSIVALRAFAAAPRIVNVPSMGDSITEGTLNAWKKEIGEFVAQDDLVAVIDTDKVSVDINAPQPGQLTKKLVDEESTVLVGQPLFELDTAATSGGATSPPPKKEEAPKTPEPEKPRPAQETPATTNVAAPSTAAAAGAAAPPPKEKKPVAAAAASKSAEPEAAGPAPTRTERVVPMTRLRLRVAERLKTAQNTAASLTTFNECDMGNVMAMRSDLNKLFAEKHGLKFGFVSAFLYAAARAMMDMPQVNAYISENGNKIVYKNYVDISVAVATKTGLLVPVIRDCERKSIVDLEKDLASLAARAREGNIALEDMAGGTFTISNGGVFGSLIGTPILNPPQSSILGLHTIKDRPIVKDGEIGVRPMMYLALTYDHRLLDGREAVTFLNAIKDKIEDPRRMLLEL